MARTAAEKVERWLRKHPKATEEKFDKWLSKRPAEAAFVNDHNARAQAIAEQAAAEQAGQSPQLPAEDYDPAPLAAPSGSSTPTTTATATTATEETTLWPLLIPVLVLAAGLFWSGGKRK